MLSAALRKKLLEEVSNKSVFNNLNLARASLTFNVNKHFDFFHVDIFLVFGMGGLSAH